MSSRSPSAVPGPPHGRRREAGGGLWQRVQSMREAEEAWGTPGWPLLRFARDVIMLIVDLVRDPRVSVQDKVVAALAVGYLAWSVDVIPDRIPILGLVDDLSILVVAVRRLIAGAGYAVIYELWRGSDEGLALVLTLGGVQR